jgi:hypothetical protein
MSFEIILKNSDVLYKIASYLSFESKYKFGKTCKMNFLKFYDFHKKYKNKKLYDLFELDDYFQDDLTLCIGYEDSCFITDNLILCIDYNKILYKFIKYNTKIIIRNDLEDCCDNIIPPDSILNIFKYDKRYNTTIKELLEKSIYFIYIRFFIEIIEDNKLDINYNKYMDIFNYDDIIKKYNIFDKITEYYIETIESNININLICSRCGVIGHDELSDCCIFYDKIK